MIQAGQGSDLLLGQSRLIGRLKEGKRETEKRRKYSFLRRNCTFIKRWKKRQDEADRNIITRGCLKSQIWLTLHHPQRTTRGKRELFVFPVFHTNPLLSCCRWMFVLLPNARGWAFHSSTVSQNEKIQAKVKLKLIVAVRRLQVIKCTQSKIALGIQFSLIYLHSVCYNQDCLQASPTGQYHLSWLLFFCYHKIGQYDFLNFHKAQH